MKKNFFNKVKLVFPIVHFLLSFLLERRVLFFDMEWDIILTIPKNDIISDAGERILGYIISKLFAAVMIFFLWFLFFWVIENIRKKKNIRFFLAFFLVGLAGVLLVWPDSFLGSIDNVITYSYAIRFLPEYWHGAYTSCVYAGALMVFPSPIFLTVFQWIFSVFTLGYLYNRILDSPVLKGKGKYSVFLFFLMPRLYSLFVDPYRTELYALLSMFVISMTVMDIVDQKKRGTVHLVCNMILCSFISVWRTEGVILGMLLFVVDLIFVYHYKPLKSIQVFGCMCVLFVMFLIPQKLGDKKYYGQDYFFINSFESLRNILLSPNSNLNYPGVEDDLAAFEAVTPVELLRYHGLEGYRRYNYAHGREDINQSFADDETASAYMRAYGRVVAHNLPIYLRTQFSALNQVLMTNLFYYRESSNQVPGYDLPPWRLRSWEIGYEDLEYLRHARNWKDKAWRAEFSGWFVTGIYKITDFIQGIYLYSFILIFLTLSEIYLFFREGVSFIRKKENQLGLAAIAFILLGQAFAIFLVMPVGAFVYFQAYYCCSFVLCLIYFNCLRLRKKGQENV